MANHAIVTQTSRTSSSSTSPSTQDRNLVIISPEQLGHMELLPDRPSRIPPLAPARPPPVALPGSAVRIHSNHQQAAGQPTRRPLPTSPLAVPRVPAPTLPVRSLSNNRSFIQVTTATTTTTTTTTAIEPEVITLSQPRPDGERVRNEYIDTPLKGGLGRATSTTSTPLHAETHIHISGSPHDHLALVSPLGSQSSKTSSTKSLPFNASSNNSSNNITPLTSPSLKRLQSTRRSLPITKQPSNLLSNNKDSGRQRDAACPSTSTTSSTTRMVFPSAGSQSSSNGGDSVICPECDRCRCLSCRTPRPLPSKWLCGDKCLCSAESCVDYASCLCCVKGLFYHCGSASDDDDQDVHRRSRSRYHSHGNGHVTHSGGGAHQSSASCADAPCSCVSSHHRMARWGCLASLTLVLPCLLCYWPLQGGVKVVEMCYQRCTRHGCRCDHQQQQQRRITSSSSQQQQQQQLTSSSSGSNKTAVVVQPLPSSGKRLLDI